MLLSDSTGLLNLGFAAFYACGAYTYALLNTKLGTRLLGLPADFCTLYIMRRFSACGACNEATG